MTTRASETRRTPIGIWIAAAVAIIFGALSVWSGARALFGGPILEAAVGEAVPFVLWFNFLTGLVYVVAGFGIALRKAWSIWFAAGLSIAVLVVFGLLGARISSGGSYEIRTVGAMVLRAGVWISITVYLRRLTKVKQTS